MEIGKKKLDLITIAVAAMAIVALAQFLSCIFQLKIGYGLRLSNLLSLIGTGIIIYELLAEKNRVLITSGFAALMIGNFINIIFTGIVNFIFNLPNFIGYTAAVLISFALTTDKGAKYKNAAETYYYIPACLIMVGSIISILLRAYHIGPSFIKFLLLLVDIAQFVAVFIIMLKLKNPAADINDIKADIADLKNLFKESDRTYSSDGMYCEPVKHILLLLLTFGIWFLIWIYRVTGYTNNVDGEKNREQTSSLLLCMFVPFYQVFWTYKTAQRIDKMAAQKYISSDLATLCMILAIFVPIIPPILMQDKLNSIAVGASDSAAYEKPAYEPKVSKDTRSVAEDLKTYKELLDNGIITQEEFDSKKKQLLDL